MGQFSFLCCHSPHLTLLLVPQSLSAFYSWAPYYTYKVRGDALGHVSSSSHDPLTPAKMHSLLIVVG